MGYNVVDIIDKAIGILRKRIEAYKKVEKENEDIPYIKIISKVILKQAYGTLEHYEKFKSMVDNDEAEEIDFRTYDRISFLVNQFNQRIYSLEFTSAREYFVNLIDFQKDVCSLYIDIQGRLVKDEGNMHKVTYELMGKMIEYKTSQIKALEEVLKKKLKN
ncbi:hypothetical protein [Clostridium hydrogenum]|uniref:hypothetical protein n=1 Tax=Clostridium hydrogenum TaxID=2855764 RepID=UPI001F1D5E77|nr:hypothetical protein [Clostridium hydrogenum]